MVASRSCLPCRNSKVKCSRDAPSCQRCIRRGIPSSCVYGDLGSADYDHYDHWHHRHQKDSVLPRETTNHTPIPPTNRSHIRCTQVEQVYHSEIMHADQVEDTKPVESQADESSSNGTAKLSPTPMTTTSDCSSRADLSGNSPHQIRSCWTKAFSEMPLPVSLPCSYKIQIPWNLTEPAKIPLTIHQLLLVLHYLFISVMLPRDEGALRDIIHRYPADWERAFVLQYSGLASWWREARQVLTESGNVHSVSIADLESQIRYILFMLGQHASIPSSFLAVCYEQKEPPYRPFGTKASVALICYAFMGVQARDMNRYDSREIWSQDESFFTSMALNLKDSPLFSAGISMHQLRSIILKLQRAFQPEELRVASTKPQSLCLIQDAERLEYYRRALLALEPTLLPKISTALGMTSMADVSIECLATLLSEKFSEAYTLEYLESVFSNVPEILQSHPDTIVVTEMFHVKALHQLCQLHNYGQSPRSLQVSLDIG